MKPRAVSYFLFQLELIGCNGCNRVPGVDVVGAGKSWAPPFWQYSIVLLVYLFFNIFLVKHCFTCGLIEASTAPNSICETCRRPSETASRQQQRDVATSVYFFSFHIHTNTHTGCLVILLFFFRCLLNRHVERRVWEAALLV